MNRNITPGTLCIIINAGNFTENVGAQVTAVKKDGDKWFVEAPRKLQSICIRTGEREKISSGWIREKNLMPISGGDFSAEMASEEKEKEGAA